MRRLIALACAFALACVLPLIPASAQVTGPVSCNANVLNTSITTATTTSLINTPPGAFVCGYLLYGASTASAMTAQFEYGTGSSCTTPTALTPALPVAASSIVSDSSFNFRGFVVPSNKSLCIVTAGTTVALGVQVFYLSNNQTAVVAQQVGSFTGAGDVVSGATIWYSCTRAYNAAYATGSNAGCNLRRASDSHTCDVLIGTSGTWTNTANCSNGADNGTAVATWCNATTCSVTKAYDQTKGNNCTSATCDIAQATAASQPTITFNCVGTSACMTGSGTQSLASANTLTTAAQPWSMSIVVDDATNVAAGDWFSINASAVFVGANGTANTGQINAGSAVTFTIGDATNHAVQVLANGASTQVNVDGAETNLSPGTGGFGSSAPGLFAQSGFFTVGNISEAGLWPTGFTLTNRTNVCKNQQAYYGAGNFGAAC